MRHIESRKYVNKCEYGVGISIFIYMYIALYSTTYATMRPEISDNQLSGSGSLSDVVGNCAALICASNFIDGGWLDDNNCNNNKNNNNNKMNNNINEFTRYIHVSVCVCVCVYFRSGHLMNKKLITKQALWQHTHTRKLPHTLICLFSVNIFTFSLDAMTLITDTHTHSHIGYLVNR